MQKKNERKAILDFFRGESISPEQINPFLTQKGSSEIRQKVKLYEILLRPEITCFELLQATGGDNRMPGSNAYYTRELLESIEVELKYKGYIERDRLLADKVGRLDGIRIMENIDFDSLLSISTEGRQKLKRYKPGTIGQAARISGISPSDINVLLLYMGR